MTVKIYKVLVILFVINAINSKRISKIFHLNLDGLNLTKAVETEKDAMKYLNRFGYMDTKNITTNMRLKTMESVLIDFQRFMGLSETGALDEKTMQMMNMPRCGVADNISPQTRRVYRHLNRKSSSKRFRRYELEGSVWETKNITWKVTKYSTRDSLRGKDKEVDAIMDYAFNEWSKHTQLTFMREKGRNKPMIEIRFSVKDHKDGLPFDGPGQTLAHAFFPQFGGDTHFDDQEPWTIDGSKGVDLLSVAVHEFGHALGLGHSDDENSLMFPVYEGKRSRLKRDDITGIEMLYGKKKRSNVRPRKRPRKNQRRRPRVRSRNRPKVRPSKRPRVRREMSYITNVLTLIENLLIL